VSQTIPSSRIEPILAVNSRTRTKSSAAPSLPTAAKNRDGKTVVHVLSDSTGNLAHHILTAMLTQFPADSFQTRFWTFLRSDEQIDKALMQIRNDPGVVMHAVVSPQVKQRIADFCAAHKLHCKDITGGFVEFLASASGITPSADPQRLHRVDEAYQRRIKAVEFTLAHDDGLGLESIGEADVVLAGVSRTSKTPTSIYLSQLGYRAANVSLARNVEPPGELLNMPSGKVVGLIIDPHRLVEIRRRRQAEWSMGHTNYDDADAVREEITWSRRLFGRQGWPVIDVTNNAVEETAARIVDLLRLPRQPGA
jgi:regulator of PEP synthase PpsR (kinase-PPPase family)